MFPSGVRHTWEMRISAQSLYLGLRGGSAPVRLDYSPADAVSERPWFGGLPEYAGPFRGVAAAPGLYPEI